MEDRYKNTSREQLEAELRKRWLIEEKGTFIKDAPRESLIAALERQDSAQNSERKEMAKTLLSSRPGWAWFMGLHPACPEEEKEKWVGNGYIPENAVPAGAREWADNLIQGVLGILIDALVRKKGEKLRQLYAIEKMVHPKRYDLPHEVIKEIADKYETRPAIARAYDVRRWMARLSRVVKPAKDNGRTIFNGPVILSPDLKTKRQVKNYEIAEKHWTQNVHLSTLAMRAYAEELLNESPDFEGVADLRSLQKDMLALKTWEEEHPENVGRESVMFFEGPEPDNYPILPIRDHSLGWRNAYLEQVKLRRYGKM